MWGCFIDTVSALRPRVINDDYADLNTDDSRWPNPHFSINTKSHFCCWAIYSSIVTSRLDDVPWNWHCYFSI